MPTTDLDTGIATLSLEVAGVALLAQDALVTSTDMAEIVLQGWPTGATAPAPPVGIGGLFGGPFVRLFGGPLG